MDIENVNDVHETAQSILDELNNVFNEYEGEVTALPSRQFISVGGPGSQPHDCEQVTITFGQIYTGTPGSPSEGPVMCDSPLSATYYVEIVRKTLPESQTSRRGSAVPGSMTPEQETALAKIQMQDARLLLEAGLRVGQTWLGSVADAAAGAESGGYQAMTATIITAV